MMMHTSDDFGFWTTEAYWSGWNARATQAMSAALSGAWVQGGVVAYACD